MVADAFCSGSFASSFRTNRDEADPYDTFEKEISNKDVILELALRKIGKSIEISPTPDIPKTNSKENTNIPENAALKILLKISQLHEQVTLESNENDRKYQRLGGELQKIVSKGKLNPDMKAHCLHGIAICLFYRKKYKKCIDRWEKAHDLIANDDTNVELKIRCLCNKGAAMCMLGDKDAGKLLFEKAYETGVSTTAFSNSDSALVIKSNLDLVKGDIEFEKAKKAFFERRECISHITTAVEYYRKILVLPITGVLNFKFLVSRLVKLGDLASFAYLTRQDCLLENIIDAVRETQEKIELIESTDEEVKNYILGVGHAFAGVALSSCGEIRETIKNLINCDLMFSKLKKHFFVHSASLIDLSLAYEQLGNFTQAKKMLEKALKVLQLVDDIEKSVKKDQMQKLEANIHSLKLISIAKLGLDNGDWQTGFNCIKECFIFNEHDFVNIERCLKQLNINARLYTAQLEMPLPKQDLIDFLKMAKCSLDNLDLKKNCFDWDILCRDRIGNIYELIGEYDLCIQTYFDIVKILQNIPTNNYIDSLIEAKFKLKIAKLFLLSKNFEEAKRYWSSAKSVSSMYNSQDAGIIKWKCQLVEYYIQTRQIPMKIFITILDTEMKTPLETINKILFNIHQQLNEIEASRVIKSWGLLGLIDLLKAEKVQFKAVLKFAFYMRTLENLSIVCAEFKETNMFEECCANILDCLKKNKNQPHLEEIWVERYCAMYYNKSIFYIIRDDYEKIIDDFDAFNKHNEILERKPRKSPFEGVIKTNMCFAKGILCLKNIDMERGIEFLKDACSMAMKGDDSAAGIPTIAHYVQKLFKFIHKYTPAPIYKDIFENKLIPYLQQLANGINTPLDDSVIPHKGECLRVINTQLGNEPCTLLTFDDLKKIMFKLNFQNQVTEIVLSNENITNEKLPILLHNLQYCKNAKKIVFNECKFEENVFKEFFQRMVNCFYQRKIPHLEISDTKGLERKHAVELARLIHSVNVVTLNLHGSNLKQYMEVFVDSLKRLPKTFETEIVFERDEVSCTVGQVDIEQEFGFSGCKISVPRDALDNPTKITLKASSGLTKLPGELVQVTPIVQCLPSGLHFKKPVTLRLPTWCISENKPINLTVFTRESEQYEWQRHSCVKFTEGKFVHFEIDHFSDDVVGASADVLCEYELLVYKSKFTEFSDYCKIFTYCIPSNEDWFNSINKKAQAMHHEPYFPSINFELTANESIVVEVKLEEESEDWRLRGNRKEFQCCTLNKNFHSTLVSTKLPDDDKKRGVELLFTAKARGRALLEEPIKAFWKPGEPDMTNIHSIRNYKFCNMQNSVVNAGGAIAPVRDERLQALPENNEQLAIEDADDN